MLTVSGGLDITAGIAGLLHLGFNYVVAPVNDLSNAPIKKAPFCTSTAFESTAFEAKSAHATDKVIDVLMR